MPCIIPGKDLFISFDSSNVVAVPLFHEVCFVLLLGVHRRCWHPIVFIQTLYFSDLKV